jgi:hypothetical protein
MSFVARVLTWKKLIVTPQNKSTAADRKILEKGEEKETLL